MVSNPTLLSQGLKYYYTFKYTEGQAGLFQKKKFRLILYSAIFDKRCQVKLLKTDI